MRITVLCLCLLFAVSSAAAASESAAGDSSRNPGGKRLRVEADYVLTAEQTARYLVPWHRGIWKALYMGDRLTDYRQDSKGSVRYRSRYEVRFAPVYAPEKESGESAERLDRKT